MTHGSASNNLINGCHQRTPAQAETATGTPVCTKTRTHTGLQGGLSNRRRLPGNRRRGAATVELAVCLPLIVMVTFGAIEGASMIFLKQTLVQSAYEGVKEAVREDATNDTIQAAALSALAGRLPDQIEIELEPADVTTVAEGEVIRVRVSAPCTANSLFPFGLFTSGDLTAEAAMIRE